MTFLLGRISGRIIVYVCVGGGVGYWEGGGQIGTISGRSSQSPYHLRRGARN